MVETLAERVKVKHGQGDDTTYKKYNASDIKIIKNGTNKKDEIIEDKEELEELERLERLEKSETENY